MIAGLWQEEILISGLGDDEETTQLQAQKGKALPTSEKSPNIHASIFLAFTAAQSHLNWHNQCSETPSTSLLNSF